MAPNSESEQNFCESHCNDEHHEAMLWRTLATTMEFLSVGTNLGMIRIDWWMGREAPAEFCKTLRNFRTNTAV